MKTKIHSLVSILSSDDISDTEIETFLTSIEYAKLKRTKEFVKIKQLLIQIMDQVLTFLSSNWNDPRYSR